MIAASLWRGTRSCRHRQMYFQLAKGTYTPVRQEVRVQVFLRDLTSGQDLTVDSPDLKAVLDPMLVSLILDNAISNASKYGHPMHPNVRITVENITAKDHPDQGLVFSVTNAAHPDHDPLTNESVALILSGKAPKNPNALSDGIGLQHCQLAALALSATISLQQEESVATFKVCIAQVPDSAVQGSASG